jgi:hypothetical protein
LYNGYLLEAPRKLYFEKCGLSGSCDTLFEYPIDLSTKYKFGGMASAITKHGYVEILYQTESTHDHKLNFVRVQPTKTKNGYRGDILFEISGIPSKDATSVHSYNPSKSPANTTAEHFVIEFAGQTKAYAMIFCGFNQRYNKEAGTCFSCPHSHYNLDP